MSDKLIGSRRSGRGIRGRRLSFLVLAVIGAGAVLVPMLAPAGEPDFANALLPPHGRHLGGTDHYGYDLLSRTASGLRISLFVGIVSAVVSTVLGVGIGLLAASFGGIVDRFLMRFTDGINSIPHLILGVVIVALFKGSIVAIVLSVALTHWTQVARVVRATVLQARESDYVAASYGAGASRLWVLTRHLAPAAAGQATVALILLMPHAIWHESALSFLGLGLQPDQPSLGTLMDQARDDIMLGAWWTLVLPALALLATTLAVLSLTPRGTLTAATDEQELAR